MNNSETKVNNRIIIIFAGSLDVCPKTSGRPKQIDHGLTSSVWGVTENNEIFRLKGKSCLARVSGELKHVTTGEAGVWGVNKNDDIYYREGITNHNKDGTDWKHITGKLKQIDSGPSGIVYGVNAYDQIFCRTGISAQKPFGTGWKQVTSYGRLKYVSCGELGCWGVNSANQIWYRSGVTSSNCAGSGWHYVPGSLKQIEAGKAGDVYGINSVGNVYRRIGITNSKTTGTGWEKIRQYGSHITTGLNGQYLLVNGRIIQLNAGKFMNFYHGIRTRSLKSVDPIFTRTFFIYIDHVIGGTFRQPQRREMNFPP